MSKPIDTSLINQIKRHLFARQEEMTEFLRQLVMAESPSSAPESQRLVQGLISGRLEEMSFEVEMIPGNKTGGHILARNPRDEVGQARQLILGHSDTVWPIGTLGTMPFVVTDEVIKGPGVYDMKAGLVQALFALETLEVLNLRPKLNPLLLINSDEEIGSPESGSVIEKLAQQVERVFVVEPSLGESGKIKTARKGVGRFEVLVEGRAAHAGLDPEKGASAILEMSHQIQRLFKLNDFEKGISVNVGTVEGGIRPNVIAPRSMAQVDARATTKADADWLQEQILGLQPAIDGVRLRINGGFNRMPLERTPRNQRLWQAAREAGKALGLNLEEGFAGGASDGNITSQYTATLDGLGAVGDGAHADHEFIFRSQWLERTALLTLLILWPSVKA